MLPRPRRGGGGKKSIYLSLTPTIKSCCNGGGWVHTAAVLTTTETTDYGGGMLYTIHTYSTVWPAAEFLCCSRLPPGHTALPRPDWKSSPGTRGAYETPDMPASQGRREKAVSMAGSNNVFSPKQHPAPTQTGVSPSFAHTPCSMYTRPTTTPHSSSDSKVGPEHGAVVSAQKVI